MLLLHKTPCWWIVLKARPRFDDLFGLITISQFFRCSKLCLVLFLLEVMSRGSWWNVHPFLQEETSGLGGALLKSQPSSPPPDMSPFFLRQYVKVSWLIGCLSTVALWRLLYWGRSSPLLTIRLGFLTQSKKNMCSYWMTKGSACSKPFCFSRLIEFAVTEQLRAFTVSEIKQL